MFNWPFLHSHARLVQMKTTGIIGVGLYSQDGFPDAQLSVKAHNSLVADYSCRRKPPRSVTKCHYLLIHDPTAQGDQWYIHHTP